jgi:hypothetical protein
VDKHRGGGQIQRWRSDIEVERWGRWRRWGTNIGVEGYRDGGQIERWSYIEVEVRYMEVKVRYRDGGQIYCTL